MEKNQVTVNGCEEKLRSLEGEFNLALQKPEINQLSVLRLKIKQQREKLRTVRRAILLSDLANNNFVY